MKDALEILTQLRYKKITITLDESGKNLKLDGNTGLLSEDDKRKLKAEKGSIVQLLNTKRTTTSEFTYIIPVPLNTSYPLSNAQKRLWILSQFHEGSVAYNMKGSYQFEGSLNQNILQQAYKALIKRHEILRTVFRDQENEISQIILESDDARFALSQHDLSSHPNGQQEVLERISEQSNSRFNLTEGPLVKAVLFKMASDRWVLTYTMHHIISDGWSMAILINELMVFYNAFLKNELPLLDSLPIQYKDYSAWQQRQQKAGAFQIHEDYWLKQFSEKIPVLEFPTDFARPKVKNYKGGRWQTHVNKTAVTALKSLCGHEGSTLFMGLIAIVKVVLYRYTGEEDIVIGTPVAGRAHIDLENQIGFYVNTLALRTRFNGEQSFIQLLNHVKHVTLDAFDHQVFPFDELIELLKINHDPSRNPLFEIMVVLQNADVSAGKYHLQNSPNLSIKDFENSSHQTSLFDLRFDFRENLNGLDVIIEYNSEIFNEDTIVRLANHFVQMTHAVLCDPRLSLHEFKYMAAEEVDRIVNRFNETDFHYPDEATLVSLFDAQAHTNGVQIAAVYGDQKISYGELFQSSNQIANFLINEVKLPQESRIGILHSRGLTMLKGLLGTLKAGAAYVPLDSDYPEDRLLYMIEDAQIDVVLTEQQHVELATKLQWRSKRLTHLVCTDSYNMKIEQRVMEGELMNKELWDYVAETTSDEISGGGWMSSFTGLHFSDAEMAEYSENIFLKLKPYLRSDMRVLEIGCSSGITLFRIAPYVGEYWGIDISPSTILKTQQRVTEKGLVTVHLGPLAADEIDQLDAENFDLIIINSVIHCFKSHQYFEDVLQKALNKLSSSGLLFLGDVMEEEKREMLISALMKFKQDQKEPAARNKTKTDWSKELFISKDFLHDFAYSQKEIQEITFSEKIHTIENELTRFRYDAILRIDKCFARKNKGQRKKFQYDLTTLQHHSIEKPHVSLIPKSLAYIIYTSGSTGMPKGCMLEHGGVVNRIDWMWNHYGFSSHDVILQKTTFTFDVSVWELFIPLCWGAKMVICHKDDIGSPQRIIKLIRDYGVTCLHFVPSMLNVFLADFHQKTETSLRLVFTSGEALPAESVKKWYQSFSTPLHNLYGPTEASVDVTYYPTDGSEVSVPIGRPIWNTQMYILDRFRQIVPIGVAGELCIGGIGLAHGYINKPELTQDKFIKHPFDSRNRVYTTGDIGKWLSDGNISFLGRKDDQVKIRGFRIELGEIENCLNGYEAIDSSVVIARLEASGDSTLVAYIISQHNLDISDLRSFLSSKVPMHMVPDRFLQVDQLPLTSSGKVDRKKLTNDLGAELKPDVQYITPRTVTEKKLIGIWETLLERTNIGVLDNFFEIGGQSLKATRLASLIQKEFETKISLKEVFDNNTPEKLALCIDRSKKESFMSIPHAPEQVNYPVTAAQQRLWILSQFEEANVAYNMPGVWKLTGDLHEHILSSAVKALIKRHEILRTIFLENENGELRQQVLGADHCDVKIDFYDVSDHYVENNLREVIHADFIQPFNLATGPLIRIRLYRIGQMQWVLTNVMHHIISDGWSMTVLMDELLIIYNSFLLSDENPLSPLSIQFKDYAIWEQTFLKSESIKADKPFWTNQFKGELPLLDLPTDRLRPAIQRYQGGLVRKTLSPEVSVWLRNICHRTGSTLFMGITTMVKALLYKYSGQTDIIVGTPMASRNHIDIENQLGLFVNTLALRTKFSTADSFEDLLVKIRSNYIDAYEHRLYPFDTLIEDLSLQRDMSRNALFDVMISLQDAHTFGDKKMQSMAGVEVTEFSFSNHPISKFDLSFDFVEVDETLHLTIEYNTDIFDEKKIVQMTTHLEQLSQSAINLPSTPLEGLDYLSDEEKRTLVVGLNPYSQKRSGFHSVIELFESVAFSVPDKIALEFGRQILSYSQVNQVSDRMASFITLRNAVQTGELIGVKMKRSEWLVITLLAVLKSGAAYVPIDNDYPPERVSFMLRDSGCKVVIDESFIEEFKLSSIVFSPIKKRSVVPHDLAYVIYTSGSTGTPKGVLIEHSSLVDYALTFQEQFHVSGQDVVIQQSSISFDTHVEEIFPALISGATLLMGKNGGRDIEEIQQLIGQGATILSSTPHVLQALNEVNTPLHQLRLLISGGDRFRSSQVSNFLGKVDIYDTYGPSESTVCATYFKVVDETSHSIIGKPLPHRQLFLLGTNNELKPIGSIGEICISGSGLARGYLNQPELTAERFVPNPYLPGALMYKTGDYGKWLADGNIQFIGRKDDQVKIRGYRIELAEIENKLALHPDIIATAVIKKTDVSGHDTLLAYFTSLRQVTIMEIRTYLLVHLPSYMVPEHYSQLPELLRLPNGKVDRRSLPDSFEIQKEEYVAPRNELERQLTLIWQELLAKEHIGIRQNFFLLGGHSLKVTQLLTRIDRNFKVRLNIQMVFTDPTIEGLAERISFIQNQDKQKQFKADLIQIEI